MVDARMENYNYWRDSRVQAAMFSPCWDIVHQESNEAVIRVDGEWVVESIINDMISEVAQKWIDEKVDFAQTYRDLKAASDEKYALHRSERDRLCKEHKGYWDIPREIRDQLDELNKESNEASSATNTEFDKLWTRAEKENPVDGYAKEMGFETFRKHDEEYRFCMRVRTKFEVCSQCSGSGKVTDPNIDCCGITQDDFYDDPGFEEDYFSGRYDMQCPRCHGKNVEAIPQFPEWLNKAIADHDESQWESIQESCQERAMGA